MICPKCGTEHQSKVLETREKDDFVYRRRECLCGFRYVTEERFVRGLPSREKGRKHDV